MAFVTKQVEASSPAARLPGIRQLAHGCAVAPGTMCKAIRVLRGLGTVTVVPGGGIFCGTVAPELSRLTDREESSARFASSLREPRWVQVREGLNRSISENRFVPGRMLPSCKELGRAYGVSHAVLGRALRSLEGAGRLQRHGRGYRVWQSTLHSGSGALDLLAQTESLSELTHATPRSREFWRVLEAECSRLNVTLRVQPVPNTLSPLDQTTPPAAGSPIGHMVLTLGLDARILSAVLARLTRTGRPVAILDEEGVDPSALGLRAEPLRKAFSLGFNSMPGEVAGAFLIGLGHRRVASIQLATDTPWCRNRTQGLVTAFLKAGLPAESVTTLTPPGFAAFGQLTAAMEQWPPIRRLSRNPTTRMEASSLSHNWDPGQLYTHRGEIRLWGQYLQELLEPLFAQALEDKRITAWVAANDVTGLLALSFLRSRRVRVPQDISLVGFDNSSEAFVSGLSSYDFNVPALVLAMLDHILPPDSRQRRRPTPEAESIPGQVMRRASVAPRQL